MAVGAGAAQTHCRRRGLFSSVHMDSIALCYEQLSTSAMEWKSQRCTIMGVGSVLFIMLVNGA